jgi:hypothetical protein
MSDLAKIERLAFLKIGDATRGALRAFRPVIEKHLAAILDAFYGHIGKEPGLAAVLTGANLDHARKAQGRHWLHIFEAKFDDAYLEGVTRIGKAHERIGLEPRWYMGGYALVLNELVALAASTYRRDPAKLVATVQAVNQAVFLDMDLATSVYTEETRLTY